ncbi:response regulator transcription factor [Streptosporangiaceae bacterium NEAU-GS5]|nr:response regulator transcription factor [Streptosporangiaceae bacterium NEAU-GS5]
MLHVLAVDDDQSALSDLSSLLREDDRIERVSTAPDAVAALREMVQMAGAGERLDGLFLDIRMDGLDGLDRARFISGFPVPPKLVFVTAHDRGAVQAFDLQAVDYLLKPIRAERLAEAVRRLAARSPKPAADVIPVELGGRTRFVSQQAVLYAEAQGDYVRLHTADGGYLVRMSLGALERRWAASGFVRTHRSTLVNARYVSELRHDDGRVLLLVGDEQVPVSRRHTRLVREQLVRHLSGHL